MKVVENIFTINYYCLDGTLFLSHLVIPLRIEVLPTTGVSVIFHYISLGIETHTQSPLNLVMKTDLIAT
jgi:hypothetical protein